MKAAVIALLVAAAPVGSGDPRIDAAAAKIETAIAALPDHAAFAGDPARWRQRIAEMCPDAEINCVLGTYERWAAALEAARSREVMGARLRGKTEMRWDARAGYTIDLTYPAFEGDRFAALNALAADGARSRAEALEKAWRGNGAEARAFGASEAIGGFEVPLVTDRLVTIDRDEDDYRGGAAHGLPSSASLLFDLARGRILGKDDLFAQGGWSERAAALAEEALRARLGGGFQGSTAAVRNVVADLSNWSFRRGAALITFPVYSVASYADGPQQVTIGYGELTPFLAAEAKLPQ